MRVFKSTTFLLLLFLLSATPSFASSRIPPLSEFLIFVMKVIIFQMPFGFIVTFLIGKSNFSNPSFIGIVKILLLSTVIGPITLIFAIAAGTLLSQLILGLGGIAIYAPIVIIISVLIKGFIALAKEYRHNSLLRIVCYQSVIFYAVIFSGLLIINANYFCGIPTLTNVEWFRCVRFDIFGTFEAIGLVAIFTAMTLLYFGQKQNNSTFIPPPTSKRLKLILAFLVTSIVLVTVFTVVKTNIDNKSHQSEGNGSEVTFVDLIQTPDSKTAVYESGNIIITFAVTDFESELVSWTSEFPYPIDDDKALLTFIQEEKRKSDKIMISSLDGKMQERADYIIARLLEAGKCSILDIRTNKYIESIKIDA